MFVFCFFFSVVRELWFPQAYGDSFFERKGDQKESLLPASNTKVILTCISRRV